MIKLLLLSTLIIFSLSTFSQSDSLIQAFKNKKKYVVGFTPSFAGNIYGNGAFINGLALNLILNQFNKMNGVSLGLLNQSGKTNGVQIGLINKTVKLKGIQIGLWNINESRSLPFINWGIK